MEGLSNDTYQKLIAAKSFIDENYSDPIDLEQISRRACLSPFHFHRIFSKVYRHTPHKYLTRKRMEKATHLLVGNNAVNQVCIKVGFESHASFSTLFKKETGYSPSEFRNKALQKIQALQQQPRLAIPHCFIAGFKLATAPAT